MNVCRTSPKQNTNSVSRAKARQELCGLRDIAAERAHQKFLTHG